MAFPLNAPMFDFLVLSVIAKGDTYGYQISQFLKQVAPMKDSALYPILKRLQENGCLSTYDRQYQGRNRRYYAITDSGQRYRMQLLQEWELYTARVNDIVKGGDIQ